MGSQEALLAAPRTLEALVAARAGERDEMRGLTDRLAALVGKVRGLEAQNTVLRVRVTESREERREREEVNVSCHRVERVRLEAEREEVRRRVFWKSTHNGDSLRSSLSLVTVAFSSLTPF